MTGWRQGWANLPCAYRGHDWEHDGPGTWSMTCLRCGDRYHLAKVVA